MVMKCMNSGCFHTENCIYRVVRKIVNFCINIQLASIQLAFSIVYLNFEKLKMVIYDTIYSTIKTDVRRPPRIHDCTQDSISKVLKFIKTFFIES